VQVIGFLRKFVKGNIMVVLRDIQFAKYASAILGYVTKFIEQVRKVINSVVAKVEKVPLVRHWVAPTLKRLQELERRFYGVQTSAMSAIPRALAELDVRLQHVLAQVMEEGQHLAHAGVPALPTRPPYAPTTRVPAQSQNPLGTPHGTSQPKPPPAVEHNPNVHPEEVVLPRVRTAPEARVPCFSAINGLAQKAGEMEIQLAAQQAGLNVMTVQQYLEGRAKFQQFGRMSSKKVARDARSAYQEKLTGDFLKENVKSGMGELAAEKLAITQAKTRMKDLAALHNPDMVAAGADVIAPGAAGMGDRRVNSSIGSQWANPIGKHHPDVGKIRVLELDKAAQLVPASERATTAMNVKLERCK
jgi:Novel toxin 15